MIMRILISAWSFYPSQEGGPSNAIYWLASGLARAGHSVRVVTTNRCQRDGDVVTNTWNRLNDFDVIYETLDSRGPIIKEEIGKCDVYITNGVCRLENYRLTRMALRLGKKVILSPRGELLNSAVNHKGKAYGLLKKMFFQIMKCSYGKKVLYHATSPEEVDSIKKYMGEDARIKLIPNYMILPEKINAKMAVEPYLLYVGRLNHIKNIEIVISGLAKSVTFMKNSLKFKIAGERKGEYYESLVAQVQSSGLSDKVEFLGLVTGEKKDKLYAGAKCLLLMSKSENFGNVIVEALSQGTPVIASKGTPWQQLNEKGAGWWIDADSEHVAETVNNLLSLDNERYTQMREEAYALSREYDIFTNIGKWVEVIEHP